MNKRYLICAYRQWSRELFQKKISNLPYTFRLISDKSVLNPGYLRRFKPEIIFFLDWSWLVPKDIVSKYKCVAFHAASLPKFRGGSPLQNQIVRGIIKTKLTAFFMDEGIDTGDILLQEDLSLQGSLSGILKKIGDLSFLMLKRIIKGDYAARKQKGRGSYFKRRSPLKSELKKEDFKKPMAYLYDFIRMLEDPYPNAFFCLGSKKIIFKSAESDKASGKLKAKVEIVEKEQS